MNRPSADNQTDRYLDGREIARGGMGKVIKTRDQHLARDVAKKVFLHKNAETPRARFLREVLVLARLEHPNIVPIYDFGFETDGTAYYTMKLIRGETLQKIINRLRAREEQALKTYTLARLLTVFRKICDAIAFAHDQGFIHRDLKPANVMVGRFGEVLVMDWGLAKFIDRTTDPDRPDVAPNAAMQDDLDMFLATISTNLTHLKETMDQTIEVSDEPDSVFQNSSKDIFGDQLTIDGALLGTPNFMSPEQARGEQDEVDHRSDVYALGAILYAILTLRPPVTGKTPTEILLKVVDGKVTTPSSLRQTSVCKKTDAAEKQTFTKTLRFPHLPGARVPASLSAVTMRALATDVKDRYQSVEELAADIDAYESGFATIAQEPNPLALVWLFVNRHRVLSLSGLILAVITAVFMVTLIRSEHRAEQSAATAMLETKRANSARNSALQAAAQAKTAEQEARTAEETATREQENTRQALGKANIALAEAAWRDRNISQLKRFLEDVPADLRDSSWTFFNNKLQSPRAEIPGLSGSIVYWGGDDKESPAFLAQRDRDLAVVDCDTGEIRRTFSAPGGRYMDISSDGQRVACGERKIFVYDIKSGELLKTLTPDIKSLFELKFSSDGKHLFIRDSRIRALQCIDIESGEQLWTTEGNSKLRAGKQVGQVAVDPRGELVAVHVMTAEQDVWFLDAATGEAKAKLEGGNGFLWDLAFSRDGQLIAGADHHGYISIWDRETTGTALRIRAAHGRVTRLAFPSKEHLYSLSEVIDEFKSSQRIQLWETLNGTELASCGNIPTGSFGFAVSPTTGNVICGGQPGTLWTLPLEPPAWRIVSRTQGTVGFLGDDLIICGVEGKRDYGISLLLKDGTTKELWLQPSSLGGADVIIDDGNESGWLHSESGLLLRLKLNGRRAKNLQMAKVADIRSSQRVWLAFAPPLMAHVLMIGSDKIQVSNLKDRGVVKEFPFTEDRCVKIDFIDNGATLAALFRNQSPNPEYVSVLRLWNVADGKVVEEVKFAEAMQTFDVSPDDSLLAIGGADKSFSLYATKTLEFIETTRCHDAPLVALAFHPRLPILATASEDLSIRFWDLDSRQQVHMLLGPMREIHSIAFSKSGNRFACTTTDHITRVWQLEDSAFLR